MTYIIAEIGVNHNGDVALAKKLIDEAKLAGADAAKFQIFITEDIVSPDSAKAEYQEINGSSGKTQYEMLKELELSFKDLATLKTYCEKKKIDFLASVFGIKELDFYVDELGCKTVKLGSGELTNAPLLLALAKKQANVILSTGMADLADIKFALGVLAFGYSGSKETPSNSQFRKASKKFLKGKVAILQCTTQYPCPDEAVNLRAMQTIEDKFRLPVGFSDHSNGIGMACAAVALGADIIEKHFTLDKTAKGPDHKASLSIEEFRQYVTEIRSVEKGLGNGKKTVSREAKKIARVATKKIVAARDIKKGEVLNIKNLSTQRVSHGGLEATEYFALTGTKSTKAYKKGEVVYG